jgi:autotransporter adhesin
LDLIPSKMTLYGTNSSNESKQLFSVGNLLNSINEDIFYGNGSATRFLLTVSFSSESSVPSDFTVKVDGDTKVKNTDWNFDFTDGSTYVVFLESAPVDGSTIVVSYTRGYSTPYVTIGNRKSGSSIKASSITNGTDCEASGNFSMAFGVKAAATNYGSVAIGKDVTASGAWSHAEGRITTASALSSHAEGYNTTASRDCSHAEGYNTTAGGPQSHAEGYNTTASGPQSHAEGSNTTASGKCSHAEGYKTIASNDNSHAEGKITTASGLQSHAEGYNTTASGTSSHAEGSSTTASGYCSHAQNFHTIAEGEAQTAIGKYNISDDTSLFIVGNGTPTERSNAFKIDDNGDIYPRNIQMTDFVVEQGIINTYTHYRKWNSGKAECWYNRNVTDITTSAWINPIYYKDSTAFGSIWNGLFNAAPQSVTATSNNSQVMSIVPFAYNANGISSLRILTCGAKSNISGVISIYATGTWK